MTPAQGSNDLVVGGKVSKVPGATGSPSFYLEARKGDGFNGTPGSDGCNAFPDAKATIKLESSNPSKIPNPAGTFQVSGCGTANAVTIPYTVSPTATAGDVTLTATATGGRGGTYTAGSFVVSITISKPADTTPPVVTATVTGTKGLDGWYTGDVRVQWNVTDDESAVTSPECPTVTISADTPGTVLSCTATSAGGTTAAADSSITVKRDATAPVISGGNVADTTWRNTDLSSGEFTASDATSGLTGASPAKFTLTASKESAGAGSPTVVTQTVTDAAGNTATRTLSALIDKTAPVVSDDVINAVWRNTDLTGSFTASDALSGLARASDAAFTLTVSAESTSKTAPSVQRYTVTDAAGNSTTRQVSALIDRTAPKISGSDVSDTTWRKSDLSQTFTAEDTLSGLNTASPTTFTLTASAESTASGPTVVTQTVTDAAGNTATRTLSALIDRTAPTASVTASGKEGLGGWYVGDVTFAASGTDALSGGVTCTAVPTLRGDSNGHTATTTCTDVAGNTKVAELVVKRDATAPAISGTNVVEDTWRKADRSESFTASDGGSGLADGGDASFTLTASAESASASTPTLVSRTVRDAAGNAATRTLSALIDKTNPTASLTSNGNLGQNGWYIGNVSFTASGSDALSGLAGCTAAPDLATDSKGHTATTTCTDVAGNTTTASSTVKRDATAPVISGADVADTVWRKADLSANFTASDETSGLADGADTSFTLTASDESAGVNTPTTVTRTVRDQAGNTTTRMLSARIDKTVPTATITPSGKLGLNGWYTSDVTFATAGTDALSGGVTCTGIAALTSDTGSTTVNTTCTDVAGNTKDASLSVKRDTTAPTAKITPSGTMGLNDWYTSNVTFTASGTDALSNVTCTAVPTLTSDTGSTTVNTTCTDTAGNGQAAQLTVKRDATRPVIDGGLTSSVLATSSTGATLSSGTLKPSDSGSGLNGALSCTPTALIFGTNSVTCTVQDLAGNPATPYTGSVTVTLGNIYTNTYNLLSPLKSDPRDLSLVKLGSTVPVKFTAPTYAGGTATDLASELKMSVSFRNVSTGDTTFEVSDANSSGSTVWRYDATTNQYIFNLSTKTGFTNAGEYDLVITYKGVVVAKGAFNLKK